MIQINLNLDRHVDNEKMRGNLSILLSVYGSEELTHQDAWWPKDVDQSQFALLGSVHVHVR